MVKTVYKGSLKGGSHIDVIFTADKDNSAVTLFGYGAVPAAGKTLPTKPYYEYVPALGSVTKKVTLPSSADATEFRVDINLPDDGNGHIHIEDGTKVFDSDLAVDTVWLFAII